MAKKDSAFANFADNLAKLPATRAATSIATLEEFTLDRAVWDATRSGVDRTRERVGSSERLNSAGRIVTDSFKEAGRMLGNGLGWIAEKTKTEQPISTATGWVKDKTTGARDFVREKGSSAWDADRIEERIGEAAARLMRRDVDALRQDLVRALSRSVTIELPQAGEPPDDDWFRALFLEIGREYSVDTEGLTDARIATEVMEAVYDDAIARVRKYLDDMDERDRQRVAEHIVELLDNENLTPEQRKEVSQAFGADELTADTVAAALKSGVLLATGYAALVGAGFGLYLAATTIVHAVMTTMLGITLPFGVYTGMTSGMALLLNPVVAIALAGGGFLLWRSRQERRLHTRLAALTVLEITIAGGRDAIVAPITAPGVTPPKPHTD